MSYTTLKTTIIMNTQPILPEDHSLDEFFDKLEEVCDCRGMGVIECLESIVRLNMENEKLKNKGREYRQKYVETLETDLKYEELIQKLKKENEELKKAHNYLRIYSICLNDWLDPCCKENHVSKEHIDETCKVFECNDDIKKQLYEDFCIEEDEEE